MDVFGSATGAGNALSFGLPMTEKPTPFLKEHQTALGKAVEKLGDPNATDDDILPALVGVCGSVLGAALGPGGSVVVGVAATVVAKRVLSFRSKSKLRKAIAELSAEEKQREILMPLVAAVLEEIRATNELDPEQRQGLATALEEIRAVQDLSLVVLNKLDGIYERLCSIAPIAALQAGTELGPYLLVNELGRGRFAHVWRGIATGRSVTLKILRSELRERPGFLPRFVDGAAAHQRLRHRSIPGLTGVGGLQHDQGYTFYAYRHVPGGCLKTEVSQLDLARALVVIHDVGCALHYMHAQGWVHCDVKPSNIIVREDWRGNLIDFDLARKPGVRGGLGEQFETLVFSPPEAAKGPIDVRSDVYSLGMTLLFALLGQRPSTERVRRDEELEALVCGDTIKAVIQKATALASEDRFQSIAEFLAKLEVACKDMNLDLCESYAGADEEPLVWNPAPRTQTDLFLSYRFRLRDEVEPLVEALERAGVRVWRDVEKLRRCHHRQAPQSSRPHTHPRSPRHRGLLRQRNLCLGTCICMECSRGHQANRQAHPPAQTRGSKASASARSKTRSRSTYRRTPPTSTTSPRKWRSTYNRSMPTPSAQPLRS